MRRALLRCTSVALAIAGLFFFSPAMPHARAGDSTSAAPALTPDATQEDFAFARRLSRVFNTVAQRVEPSVVHIESLRRVTPTDMFGFPLGEARLTSTGLGSGVIIDSAGVIVTNNHVIRGAEALRIKLVDGRQFPATLLGRDEATDLAVLRIDAPGVSLTATPFADSDALEVGEWVVAIGSPFGLDRSVTQGIISAKGRTVTPRETRVSFEDYIQTDAAINPGNSGGPLLNLEGRIVGINTAIASRTGGYDGIGFAIPSNTVRAVVDQLLRSGRVIRGWLGVEWEEVRDASGVTSVVIQRVLEDSPAAIAGLREGDRIARFQGVPATQLARLRSQVGLLPPGSQVRIDVTREGQEVSLEATLGDLNSAMAAQLGASYVSELGVSVRDLSAPIARRLGLPKNQRGVVIVDVERGGRSDGLLRQGDVLVGVGIPNQREQTDLDTPQSLTRAVRELGASNLRLYVIRDRQMGYVDI